MDRIIFIVFFSLLSSFTYGLVDYSEPEFEPANSGAQRITPKRKVQKVVTKRPQASRKGSSKFMSLGTYYQSVDAKLENGSGKAHFMGVEGTFYTRYNLFLNYNYWQAKSSSEYLSESPGTQKGNPEVVIGLNWLRFGNPSELATIDFYGGMTFSGDSEFATSRNDQIVGVSTAKRFQELALGIGYEMRITGDPKTEKEMSVGNITRLSSTLGWMTSDQIRFSLDGHLYSVSSSSSGSPRRLEEKVKFSSMIPKLGLKLSPAINMELGAIFRTRRLKQGELIGARLWNLKGAYGNSIFAKIDISI